MRLWFFVFYVCGKHLPSLQGHLQMESGTMDTFRSHYRAEAPRWLCHASGESYCMVCMMYGSTSQNALLHLVSKVCGRTTLVARNLVQLQLLDATCCNSFLDAWALCRRKKCFVYRWTILRPTHFINQSFDSTEHEIPTPVATSVLPSTGGTACLAERSFLAEGIWWSG